MRKKPDVLNLDSDSAYPGMFTVRCHDIDTAYNLFVSGIKDWGFDEKGYTKIIKENIKKERMYHCKNCEYYTIGEAICCQCDHYFTSNGRETFVYYFENHD